MSGPEQMKQKKHKIEATDIKILCQRPSEVRQDQNKRLKLFIADVKLLCQCY